MALYTPGRRRAILLLLLSSLLILTIDLRGNAIFDAIRTGLQPGHASVRVGVRGGLAPDP